MDKLDNKNWTKDEALANLGNPENKKSKKRKRVFPKFPYGGLGVHRDHPLILKLGGYTGEKKSI